MITLFKTESYINKNRLNDMTVKQLNDLIKIWDVKITSRTGFYGKILKDDLIKSIREYTNSTNISTTEMLKRISGRIKITTDYSAPYFMVS